MSQPITKPSHAFMRGIIEAFYQQPGNGAGGSLHIVLDDLNVEDSHVDWCREYAAKNGDHDGVFLAELLLQYTDDEREGIIEGANI